MSEIILVTRLIYYSCLTIDSELKLTEPEYNNYNL